MTEKRYTAVVRVAVDINVEGIWGENTTVKQIQQQAKEKADLILENLRDENAGVVRRCGRRIGNPQLLTINIMPEQE